MARGLAPASGPPDVPQHAAAAALRRPPRAGARGESPLGRWSAGSSSYGAPPQVIDISVRGGRHRCQAPATAPASWEVGIPKSIVPAIGRAGAGGRVSGRCDDVVAHTAGVLFAG